MYGLTPAPVLGTAADLGLRAGDVARRRGWRTSSGVEPAPRCPTAAPGRPSRRPRSAWCRVGYADGIPRAAGNRGQVAVDGRRARSWAGSPWTSSSSTSVRRARRTRATMCMCSAPVSTVSPRRTSGPTPLDTIGYEIVTRIGSRVPREYVEGQCMSPEVTPALRMAGRGLLAAGALAAGAALGAVAERSLLRAVARRARGRAGRLRDHRTATCASVDGVRRHDAARRGRRARRCRRGDVLTVVFAHGYALNLDSWHYQRQALRGRARLVLYDQRSHGRSQRADFDTHHVDQLGSDLGSVIDAVAPTGPLMLVGHSMGGMTIMALAAQRPELFAERIYGVALIATTAGGLSSGQLGLPAGVGRAVPSDRPTGGRGHRSAQGPGREAPLEPQRPRPAAHAPVLVRVDGDRQASRFVASMVSATPIDVVAEFLPALQEHDKRAVLGVFEGVELLVIVGDSDRLTPKEQSAEIVRRVPGAEYVVVADSGHMLTLEKHEEVDAHLVSLLERVRRDIAAEASDGAA